MCALDRVSAEFPSGASSVVAASAMTLSRVLICPCSQSPDTALLAAAGYHAMLDLLDTMAGRLSSMPSRPGSTADDAAAMTALGSAAPAVVVLGEVCRAADLILQFTRRYDGIVEDAELREAMLALAEEMKIRLQAVIERAVTADRGFPTV